MACIDKDELVLRATLAEQAERYDDMASAMKSVTETGIELSNEERRLLTDAYKYILKPRRAACRVIFAIEQKAEGIERQQQIAKEYRQKVEMEIIETCNEILCLLEMYLLPRSTNVGCTVENLTRKADYYRYITEVATGDARNTAVANSQQAYQLAYEISQAHMAPTHPLRLAVALNFAVFYYEILKSRHEACELAKQALNGVIEVVDQLDQGSLEACTLVLDVIIDNYLHWTRDVQAELVGQDAVG